MNNIKFTGNEIVTIVCLGEWVRDVSLKEAVRIIVEDFPDKTPKQLSSSIKGIDFDLGPLSVIRKLYVNFWSM